MSIKSVALAMTGASGVDYGLRLLEVLLTQRVRVHLMISNPGRMVIAEETDLRLPSKPQEICNDPYFISERDAASKTWSIMAELSIRLRVPMT